MLIYKKLNGNYILTQSLKIWNQVRTTPNLFSNLPSKNNLIKLYAAHIKSSSSPRSGPMQLTHAIFAAIFGVIFLPF
jgi:hypothetical protein